MQGIQGKKTPDYFIATQFKTIMTVNFYWAIGY